MLASSILQPPAELDLASADLFDLMDFVSGGEKQSGLFAPEEKKTKEEKEEVGRSAAGSSGSCSSSSSSPCSSPSHSDSDSSLRLGASVVSPSSSPLAEVRIERPDLESVFLKLTGRSLRD